MTPSWLCSLFLNPLRSDLDVECVLENGNSVRFPAHSPILCAQSIFFRERLSSSQLFQEVRITNFPPRVVEYFLRFFYTNSIPGRILMEDLLSLLELAHFSGTQSLVERCGLKLSFEVNIDTVCEVYEIAKRTGLPYLVQKCHEIICRCWQVVIKNDLHLSFSQISYEFFLMSTIGVSAPSNLPARAYKRWLNWNSCANGKTIEDIDQMCNDCSFQDYFLNSPYICTDYDNPWPCDLYCSAYLSDIDIAIEHNETACFPAHSLVLNKHSDVFLKNWTESTSVGREKRRYKLKKCEARIVDYFLRFLYTRFFPSEISLRNLLGLHLMADEFRVEELKHKCWQVLQKRITKENCCHILVMTRNVSYASIPEECIRIAAQHLTWILSNYLHFSLDLALLASVFRASGLKATTTNEYLQAWGKFYCAVLGHDLRKDDGSSQVEALVAAANM